MPQIGSSSRLQNILKFVPQSRTIPFSRTGGDFSGRGWLFSRQSGRANFSKTPRDVYTLRKNMAVCRARRAGIDFFALFSRREGTSMRRGYRNGLSRRRWHPAIGITGLAWQWTARKLTHKCQGCLSLDFGCLISILAPDRNLSSIW